VVSDKRRGLSRSARKRGEYLLATLIQTTTRKKYDKIYAKVGRRWLKTAV